MRYMLLAIVCLSGLALADDSPIIRITVDPPAVTVGQEVTIRVTLLVPTWFPAPPDYPDFELVNAVTRLGASRPTSERIGGDTWSGIVREFRVSPLAAGSYTIADERIRLSYANPGADPVRQEVAVPTIRFDASVPAGAEQLDPYVAGTRLTLNLNVEGADQPLEAGAAVVLNYEATLDGLPAIFLPPLAPQIEAPGLSVYLAEPQTEDGPPALRREQLTLVFAAGGSFEIPATTLSYWNTETGQIETAKVDGLSLTVAGPPVDPPVAATRPDRTTTPWRWVVLAGIALVLLAIARLRPVWLAHRQRVIARRKRSEGYAFKRLKEALTAGHADSAYAWLLQWIKRLDSDLDSRMFAEQYGDDALPANLESLFAARFGAGAASVDLAILLRQLVAARQRYLRASPKSSQAALQPLNPA